MQQTTGEVLTRDGVTLRYLEAGQGEPLVIVPGFSCTSATFRHQLDGLSDRFRVIALDMRGHGESDRPAHGYRIARLAADVHDSLAAMNLSGVTLMGHSLGCVVLWSYIDLFGADRLAKLILVDQPAVVQRHPDWTDETVRQTGAAIAPDEVAGFARALETDREAALRRFFGAMVTEQLPSEELDRLIAETVKLPGDSAAQLFRDGVAADYRDVLPRITVPTLYIGGRYKTVRMSAQRWICEQIPGARHVTFSAEERGSHFMYLENPQRFNEVVAEFMGS